MTQTSEPGTKSEHSEDERTCRNGHRLPMPNAHAMGDNSEHRGFAAADLETNSGLGFLPHSARSDELRIQQIAGAATAFLFAGLAPALVAAALWHTAKIAPVIFAFTFAIALGHAALFGLPLFLVFRSKGWINVVSCIIFGFAIGAVPIGVLTWPTQHPGLHTLASVDGVPTIINGIITVAGWVSYVKPLIYFGSFGTLGGFTFWVALIWSGTFGKAGADVAWRLIMRIRSQ